MTLQPIDNSDLAVEQRRLWLGEQYLAGMQPQVLYKLYKDRYNLSKHSFDKDITVVRNELATSVRENFDSIVNDQYTFLNNVIAEAMARGDDQTALRAQKGITDLLKLVNVHGKSVNVQINNNTANVQLPTMTVEEIKALLGR